MINLSKAWVLKQLPNKLVCTRGDGVVLTVTASFYPYTLSSTKFFIKKSNIWVPGVEHFIIEECFPSHNVCKSYTYECVSSHGLSGYECSNQETIKVHLIKFLGIP